MNRYRVVRDITSEQRVFPTANPKPKKVVAKAGTILIPEKNFDKIGAPTDLRTIDGKFICQVGSAMQKTYCVEMTEEEEEVSALKEPVSLKENLSIVFKEYLDGQNQSYDKDATLEELKELVETYNPATSTFVIATLYSEALDKTDNKQ